MEQQIKQLIQDTLIDYELPASFSADFDLINQGGVDSLGMLSLSSAVQKHFGIKVKDHEWNLLRSVQAIQTFVEAHQNDVTPATLTN